MHIGEWVHAHPTETALIAIGGGLILLVAFKGNSAYSGSGSEIASYENAQLSALNLSNQNAATQAAAQAQEQQTQAEADVANNQTEAALAAAALQYKAGTETAQIQAGVENNYISTAGNVSQTQIQTEGQVANNTVSAEEAAAIAQINGEMNATTEQFNYLQDLANNQNQLQEGALNQIPNIGGSQNRLALVQSVLNQPNAASATEGSYLGVTQSNNGLWQGLIQGISQTLTGLFG